MYSFTSWFVSYFIHVVMCSFINLFYFIYILVKMFNQSKQIRITWTEQIAMTFSVDWFMIQGSTALCCVISEGTTKKSEKSPDAFWTRRVKYRWQYHPLQPWGPCPHHWKNEAPRFGARRCWTSPTSAAKTQAPFHQRHTNTKAALTATTHWTTSRFPHVGGGSGRRG